MPLVFRVSRYLAEEDPVKIIKDLAGLSEEAAREFLEALRAAAGKTTYYLDCMDSLDPRKGCSPAAVEITCLFYAIGKDERAAALLWAQIQGSSSRKVAGFLAKQRLSKFVGEVVKRCYKG